MDQTEEQEPIRYAELLAEHYRAAGHPPYRWSVHDAAPFAPLKRPLPESTVTMLTAGGISERAQSPWNAWARNDHRLDAIPVGVDSAHLQIHDAYYDHADADRDINCQFPVDRLRELRQLSEIGTLAPRLWSGFMGRIYDRSRLVEQSAPAFAAALKEDHVDLLIAVPA